MKWTYIGIGGAVAILLLGGAYIAISHTGASSPADVLHDANTIAQGAADFKELSARFEKLAKDKGALYAYDVLRHAQLPPGTDVHLLGHTIGDVLYQQTGVAGIADCTQEFRNACSHTIVIGALQDFGEAALPKIHDACLKAPGGSGAYTMCYHGLGHGVFAYFEYDLPKTIAFCKKTGTADHHDEEYVQCVGGAIMELMGGGGHDHDAWLVSRDKYLSKTDPLAPCSTSVIPSESKGFCYTYITPHLFEFAGGNLGNPQPADFKASFGYCDTISKSTPDQRRSCFAGIGKEFPLLAVARDTRALSAASDANLSQMRTWCTLAPHSEAYNDCTNSIVDSLFWGGENNAHVSIKYCALASGADAKECFQYLTGIAHYYLKDPQAHEAFCSAMPAPFAASCRTSS